MRRRLSVHWDKANSRYTVFRNRELCGYVLFWLKDDTRCYQATTTRNLTIRGEQPTLEKALAPFRRIVEKEIG